MNISETYHGGLVLVTMKKIGHCQVIHGCNSGIVRTSEENLLFLRSKKERNMSWCKPGMAWSYRHRKALTIKAFSSAVIATGRSFVTSFTNPIFARVMEMLSVMDCATRAVSMYRLWLRTLNCTSRDSRKKPFAAPGWPHMYAKHPRLFRISAI